MKPERPKMAKDKSSMSTSSSTTSSSTSSTTNTYVLTASIDAAGDLQLSGPDLVNGVIETPSGQDATVIIDDMATHYLYAAQVPTGGANSNCWTRDTTLGRTQHDFLAVSSVLINIVYAAETTNNAKIKYGPVITIKPKG